MMSYYVHLKSYMKTLLKINSALKMENLCLSDTNKKLSDENKNWKMMTEKVKSSPIISS